MSLAQDLKDAWDDAAVHDLADGPSGVFQIVEGGQGRAGGRRFGIDLQGDLGHHPQGALGAHEKPGQVIAGHTFHGARPRSHDPPVREHHLKAQDVIARGPVLGPLHPARVGCHISPEGADLAAGRVGREKEPVGRKGLFKVCIDHARLHHRQPVLDADLKDLVHAGEVKDDTASGRDRHS